MRMMTSAALLGLFCVLVPMVTAQREDLSRFIDKFKGQGLSEEDVKAMTFDSIMSNLLPKVTQNRAANLLQLPTNNTLVELDMMINKDQLEQFYGSRRSKTGRKKRKAVKNAVYRWKDRRVPYVILKGRDQLTDYDRFMMKVSMREWEKYTCIRFDEKRPEDKNYVVIRDGAGCNSQLGMVGGKQDLNLDKTGCRFKGLYLHEIGHALGLVHEHQRPIRDDWIEIIKENVEPNMRIWFDKYNTDAVERFDVDYEYSSVMHYGITAFSKRVNGKNLQTIRAKQPGREKEIGRVYQKELSFTDIKSVNRMYKCDEFCFPDDPETPKCTDGGFLDQNCKCLCKDGSSDCTVGKQVDRSCTNTHDDWTCFDWAKQGECINNPAFMTKNCRKACGICGDAFDDYKELEGICDDFYDTETCEKWKDNYDCVVNEQWMKQNCKRTCGYCDANKPPPGSRCRNTYTDDEKCELWARKGECSINHRWMPQNCQKACRTCSAEESDEFDPFDPRRTPATTTVRDRRVTTTTTPRTTPAPTPTTTIEPIGGGCENRYNDRDCEIWARHNHCNINPGWMKVNCERSCKSCPEEKSCENGNKYCDSWAQAGFCVARSDYMHVHCRKACRVCNSAFLPQTAMQGDDPNAGSASNTTDFSSETNTMGNMSSVMHGNLGFTASLTFLVGLLTQILG